jgi:hypothetical protein
MIVKTHMQVWVLLPKHAFVTNSLHSLPAFDVLWVSDANANFWFALAWFPLFYL